MLCVLSDSAFSRFKTIMIQDNIRNIFNDFTNKFKKNYLNEIEKNFKYVKFNEKFRNLNKFKNKYRHRLGVTKFFDLDEDEFHKTYLTFKMKASESLPIIQMDSVGSSSVVVASTIDWSQKIPNWEPREQKKCGCCWAFSAVGNIEALYFIKYKKFKSFSEQYLLNCVKTNQGCDGGTMLNAFKYIISSKKLVAMSSAPYLALLKTCNYSKFKTAVSITGYKFSDTTDENQIASWLVKNGPLSIGINGIYLQYYQGGIIDLSKDECNPLDLNHAALLVGYGIENGVEYWKIRNSWGTDWGEDGYFRVSKGKGTCGINNYVISAIIN